MACCTHHDEAGIWESQLYRQVVPQRHFPRNWTIFLLKITSRGLYPDFTILSINVPCVVSPLVIYVANKADWNSRAGVSVLKIFEYSRSEFFVIISLMVGILSAFNKLVWWDLLLIPFILFIMFPCDVFKVRMFLHERLIDSMPYVKIGQLTVFHRKALTSVSNPG